VNEAVPGQDEAAVPVEAEGLEQHAWRGPSLFIIGASMEVSQCANATGGKGDGLPVFRAQRREYPRGDSAERD
jgi:hypothetical protein